MDVATLERELQQLPGHLQDRIAAFLTVLRLKRDGADELIHNRLNDADSGNWKSWKEAKRELGIENPDEE